MQPDSSWLELRSQGSSSIRLCFVWCGDRYAHRFEWNKDGQSLIGLQSLEGADHEAWPSSPALQQLNLQPNGSGGCCALLLGMAGKNHWSASIERQAESLVFDIACRAPGPVQWLGSSYQINSSCRRVAELVDGSYQLVYGGDGGRFVLRIVADRAGLAYDQQQGRINVLPLPAGDDRTMGARWSYSVQLIASDDATHEGARS
jgi:hypothetical protein